MDLQEGRWTVVDRLKRLARDSRSRFVVGVLVLAGAWFVGEGWVQEIMIVAGAAALALSIGRNWKWRVVFGIGVLFIGVGIVARTAGLLAIFALVLGTFFFLRAMQLRPGD